MLKAGYEEKGQRYETPRGTPQGGVVSPLLSNILLTPFDKEMRQKGYRLTRWAARRSALLASPLLRPAWLRWRRPGSASHCKVNCVLSILPSARKARDKALPAPGAESLRRMIDGMTTLASIEALSRMSSAHWLVIAAGTAASLGVRRQSLADAGVYRWRAEISVRSLNQAYHCRPRSEPAAGDWPLSPTSAFVGIYSFAGSPGNWPSPR